MTTVPTASKEEIRIYQEQVEKNLITPDKLPVCSCCNLDSAYFKVHAYRERRFLVLIEKFVNAVFSTLVRFRCPGCNKTFTYYPSFALPYKHYTRQTIMGFAQRYVENNNMTYEQTVMIKDAVPGYPECGSTLAPGTVHKWIGTLGQYRQTISNALSYVFQKNPDSNIHRKLAGVSIAATKYRSHQRWRLLIRCRKLGLIESEFSTVFKISIFTGLAISCSFG